MDSTFTTLKSFIPSEIRILVVDDEEAIRRNVRAGLEDFGYLVEIAANGEEALKVFCENPSHLVITDLRMPEMSGLELISLIQSKRPGTPVIVLSGTGAVNDAIEAMRQGAWDYLVKPIEHPNEIDLAIRRNLERAWLLTENRRYQNHLEELVEEKTKQLREYATRMVSSREEERLRISSGIHDEVGQLVSSIRMNLSWMNQRIASGVSGLDEVPGRIDEMMDHLQMATEAIRRICADLRPPQLDNLGFEAAIEWLVKQFQKASGIQCRFDYALREEPRNPDCAIAFYRILQEALTNVSKHSQASEVAIEFHEDQGSLVLLFRDNGKGLDLKSTDRTNAFGLVGIRERAAAFGGDFKISGERGKGTEIEVRIPLEIAGMAANQTGATKD